MDKEDENGDTYLLVSSKNKQRNVVAYLLKRGAIVDKPDIKKRKPLWHAVVGNEVPVARELLASVANVNVKPVGFNFPLEHCAKYGYQKLSELLLGYKASIVQRCWHGNTSLQIAVQHNHPEIIQMLEVAAEKDRKRLLENIITVGGEVQKDVLVRNYMQTYLIPAVDEEKL